MSISSTQLKTKTVWNIVEKIWDHDHEDFIYFFYYIKVSNKPTSTYRVHNLFVIFCQATFPQSQ